MAAGWDLFIEPLKAEIFGVHSSILRNVLDLCAQNSGTMQVSSVPRSSRPTQYLAQLKEDRNMIMNVYHKVLTKVYEISGGKDNQDVDLIELLRRKASTRTSTAFRDSFRMRAG